MTQFVGQMSHVGRQAPPLVSLIQPEETGSNVVGGAFPEPVVEAPDETPEGDGIYRGRVSLDPRLAGEGLSVTPREGESARIGFALRPRDGGFWLKARVRVAEDKVVEAEALELAGGPHDLRFELVDGASPSLSVWVDGVRFDLGLVGE